MNIMDCDKILVHLASFLREETGPIRTRAIKRHMETCPQCKEMAQHMCKCLEVLMAAPQPSLSQSSRARAIEALKAARGGKPCP